MPSLQAVGSTTLQTSTVLDLPMSFHVCAVSVLWLPDIHTLLVLPNAIAIDQPVSFHVPAASALWLPYSAYTHAAAAQQRHYMLNL